MMRMSTLIVPDKLPLMETRRGLPNRARILSQKLNVNLKLIRVSRLSNRAAHWMHSKLSVPCLEKASPPHARHVRRDVQTFSLPTCC
jgi:hypothetical protein